MAAIRSMADSTHKIKAISKINSPRLLEFKLDGSGNDEMTHILNR